MEASRHASMDYGVILTLARPVKFILFPLSRTVRSTVWQRRTRGGELAARVWSSVHLGGLGMICEMQISTRSRRPREVNCESFESLSNNDAGRPSGGKMQKGNGW